MDNKFPNQLFVITHYLPSALQIQSCWSSKSGFKLSVGTAKMELVPYIWWRWTQSSKVLGHLDFGIMWGEKLKPKWTFLFSSIYFSLLHLWYFYVSAQTPKAKSQLFLILIWFSGFTKHPCCLLRRTFWLFAVPYAHLFLSLAVFIRGLSLICCSLSGHIDHFVPGCLDLPTLFTVHGYAMLLHLLLCSEPKLLIIFCLITMFCCHMPLLWLRGEWLLELLLFVVETILKCPHSHQSSSSSHNKQFILWNFISFKAIFVPETP